MRAKANSDVRGSPYTDHGFTWDNTGGDYASFTWSNA
jgi:hypothetical protein